MYTLVMTINHHYWERDHEHHCVRQMKKETLESHSWKQGKAFISSTATALQNKANLSSVASPTKNSFYKSSSSPASKKQPNTPQVDLSSKLASNGKLTSDEHKKCLENNLCFYCSTGDHKLDSCSKKQTMVFSKGHSVPVTANPLAAASEKPSEK